MTDDNDDIDLYGWYLTYQTTEEFALELAARPLPKPEYFFMLDFFERRCAICRELTLLQPIPWLASALYVSLDDLWANLIPVCDACASTRDDQLPFAWLRNRFGAARARPIMLRIDAYRQAVYNK